MAYEVLVATPDTPLMDAWAPLVPSRNSRLAYTGSPLLVSPTATRRSMRSKQSALRRSSPCATRATSPGCGGTKTSGSTRVT